MKKILVTGVAGFIGSKVAAALLRDGISVVGIDNLSTGKLSAVPSGVIFIEEDAFSPDLEHRLVEHDFEAVMHIAGQSSAEISFSDPIYDLRSNAESTLVLLNYCVKNSVNKFIFASSSTVYGEQSTKATLHEELTPNPVSFYAVGKLASEYYLKLYAKEFGLTTNALRLFNVFGPGQNLDNLSQGMVSIFLAQALGQKHILVKGSADRFRDFVYIDDVVQTFISAFRLNNKQFNLCNVCSGQKVTVDEIVAEIQRNLPYKVSVEYRGNTRGDIFGQVGCDATLKDRFSLPDFLSFNEGLKRMIMWASEE